MKHILLNNLGSKHGLIMKFVKFMQYYKISFLIKIFYEKCDLETSSRSFFNFQRILCKKDSVEVSMLIWTNFDRFAITYLSSLLQKFHLPIEVMLHSLQTQKGLELVFRLQFSYKFLIKFFLL